MALGGLVAATLGRLDAWTLGYLGQTAVANPDAALVLAALAVLPLGLGIASVGWRRRRARAARALR